MTNIDPNLLPVRIFRKNTYGKYIYANSAGFLALGKERLNDLIGTTDFDYYEHESASQIRLEEEDLLKNRMEYRNQLKQIKWIKRDPSWSIVSKILEYDALNNPSAILIIEHDVSEMHSQLLRYQQAIDGHPDGVWQFDLDKEQLWLSRRCLEILGYDEKNTENNKDGSTWRNINARKAIDLVHKDDQTSVKTLYQEISYDNPTGEVDCRIIRKDKSICSIRLRITASFQGENRFPQRLFGSIIQRTNHIQQDSYRAFIDLVPSFIFVKDSSHEFTFVNKALIEGFGRPVDQIIGKTDAILNSNKRQVEQFERDDNEVLASGKPIEIPAETFDHFKMGKRVLKTIKVPLPKDDSGRHSGLVGVSSDITELWNVQQFLDALMQNVPDNIFFKDTEHKFIRVNESMARNIGKSTPEQFIGKTDFDFFPIEEAERMRCEEKGILESGESIKSRIVKTNPTAYGFPQWRSITKSPVYDPNGEIVGIVGITHDLTEQINAKNLLSSVLDNIPLQITLQNNEGKFLLCNRAFSQHVGIPDNKLIGSTLNVIPDKKAAKKLSTYFQSVLNGETVVAEPYNENDSSGNKRIFSLTLVPLSDESLDESISSIITIRDESSQLVEREKTFHHTLLELLNRLRIEEQQHNQHFLLLLAMTHADAFQFNRAISWVFNTSRPNELEYVCCIGQKTFQDSKDFARAFDELSDYPIEKCIRDFHDRTRSVDNQLDRYCRSIGITINQESGLGKRINEALNNNSHKIIVDSGNMFRDDLSPFLKGIESERFLTVCMPLGEHQCIVFSCDNIRTKKPVEVSLQNDKALNDFLRSSQLNIMAAQQYAKERQRLSKEKAAREVAHIISHILGNILPFTLGAVKRIQSKQGPTNEQHLESINRDFNAINGDLGRAISLVEGFRCYAKANDQTQIHRKNISVREFFDVVYQYLCVSEPSLEMVYGSIPADVFVDVDIDRLKMDCFAQLLKNAKDNFNGTTEIKCVFAVSLCLVDQETGLGQNKKKKWVEFSFSDNGPGVPHEDKRSVFDLGFSKKPKGSGLGLSIAKSLIDQHGGVIYENGVPGKGADFRVRLSPLSKSSKKS
jgi:PAS domain S-box-containing protein